MARRVKFSKKQLSNIGKRFESGEDTASIAKAYGISPQTVRNYAKNHGWKKGRTHKASVNAAVEHATKVASIKMGDSLSERIVETNETFFKINGRLLENLNKAIALQEYQINRAIKIGVAEKSEADRDTELRQSIEDAAAAAEGRPPIKVEPAIPRRLTNLAEIEAGILRLAKAITHAQHECRVNLGIEGKPFDSATDDPLEAFLADAMAAREESGIEATGP